MTKLRQLIRNTIVNESGGAAIRAIVGQRAYPAQIASLTNPVYPCINFEISLGPIDTATTVYDGTMRVWCWSRQHEGTQDEAWDLFQALVDYWHQSWFSNATLARYVQLIQSGEPVTTFDEEARAYSVVSNWQIFGATTS